MHADALPPPPPRDESWGVPILLAVVIHLLVALVFIVAWLWSPQRQTDPAAGDPSLEASLDVSAADARVARQALRQTPEPVAVPDPTPPEPAPEDTVPPPQPIPEPRPQDAPTPQQQQAQERIAEPDNVDQERVSAMAIAEEKAKQEQEAKRRQEQIDLTERQRQEEAEQKLRLAKQQEEADKKKAAEQQAAEREQKLAELRKRREQAEREAQLAEQKLRQLASARQAAAAATSASTSSPQTTAGQNGTNTDLTAQYAAAIQQAVLAQWLRPDSVPLGQRCSINIRQLPGGQVVEAKVSANCPYDEAGKRSIEAAVLRAQPLPYRGFESVFQRNLTFNFTAQDR